MFKQYLRPAILIGSLLLFWVSLVHAQSAEINTYRRLVAAGSARLQQGDHRGARDAFEEVLRYVDTDSAAHLGLGIRDLVALLPDTDGKGGAVTVTTRGGYQILDKPGYATKVEDVNKPPLTPRPISENEIKDVFGPALSALPDPAGRLISFLLYFEHDTAELTQESKNLLPEVLKTIKNRESNEVYVAGHTDLVGTEGYNKELSLKRATYVRDLFVSNGIKSGALFVSYYGKSRPLVLTKDDVPEPRNRRVEVIVR